jgi:hypothetical protein
MEFRGPPPLIGNQREKPPRKESNTSQIKKRKPTEQGKDATVDLHTRLALIQELITIGHSAVSEEF